MNIKHQTPNIKHLIIILSLFIFISCRNNSSSDDKNLLTGRYEIKKGIVETEINMQGFAKMNAQLIFDDYGKLHKQIIRNTVMMGAGKIETVVNTLIQDTYIYTWNDGETTGSKISLDKDDNDIFSTDFNFKKISKEFKDKYQLKEIGTKNIKGKSATIYTLEINGSKLKYFIWKNIPLEFEVELEDRTVKSHLINIEENPKFDKSTFELPKNITFEEMNLNDDDTHEHSTHNH